MNLETGRLETGRPGKGNGIMMDIAKGSSRDIARLRSIFRAAAREMWDQAELAQTEYELILVEKSAEYFSRISAALDPDAEDFSRVDLSRAATLARFRREMRIAGRWPDSRRKRERLAFLEYHAMEVSRRLAEAHNGR